MFHPRNRKLSDEQSQEVLSMLNTHSKPSLICEHIFNNYGVKIIPKDIYNLQLNDQKDSVDISDKQNLDTALLEKVKYIYPFNFNQMIYIISIPYNIQVINQRINTD